MNDLTIGKVAREAGIGIETVRFYERERLLAPPARSASGYRFFNEDTVPRLNFIKRAKDLGFTLAEIRDLLAFNEDTVNGCGDVKVLVEEKIAGVEAKIEDLKRIRKGLKTLAQRCPGTGASTQCPILAALTNNK
ncbi:MAG: heavy metal-responsive transcriptional regulator [Verrucomicrobiota bacterium]|nr:heavy metal-responsive transcriptional regulator [Verrucomicrobiota bacterium]